LLLELLLNVDLAMLASALAPRLPASAAPSALDGLSAADTLRTRRQGLVQVRSQRCLGEFGVLERGIRRVARVLWERQRGCHQMGTDRPPRFGPVLVRESGPIPIEALAPSDLNGLMAGYDRPWWIAGGWAIDLYLGRPGRRVHSDLDVAVLRRHARQLRAAFTNWDMWQVVGHRRLAPWSGALDERAFSVWARRTPDSPWAIEFLLERATKWRWYYRRNHTVTLRLDRLGRLTPSGTPYLAPEVVLLYKAMNTQPRDTIDFGAVRLALGTEPRHWLRSALEVAHPGHPWTHGLAE
jgi:hypothetical protein